jgi:multiple sugar transport system ATP-binding protein
MDEPMSHLDAQLRSETRSEIVRLQRRLGITTVYVTHDQVEAMAMGHRVAVMNHGRIAQCGTPMEIYDAPVDLFVARFMGSPPMSILRATVTADREALALRLGRADVPLDDFAVSRHPQLHRLIGRDVAVGLRSEAVRPDDDGPIVAEVAFTEPLGATQLVHATVDAPGIEPAITGVEAGDTGHGSLLTFVGTDHEVSRWRPLRLSIDTGRLHFFDLDTHRAIPAADPTHRSSDPTGVVSGRPRE